MIAEKKKSGTKNGHNWGQNGSDRDETLPKCIAECEDFFYNPPGAGKAQKIPKNPFFRDLSRGYFFHMSTTYESL